MSRLAFFLLALLCAAPAAAWWNGEWTSRQGITLNTSPSGIDAKQPLQSFPVLVRLSTGKFDFIGAKEDGADLRFVAGDDKTPLKFHIESFDPVNEMALVWVQVPRLPAGAAAEPIWLYSGNEKATSASDPKGTYDERQLVVLHFAEKDGAFRDATAYGHAVAGRAAAAGAGLIGNAATFDGGDGLTVSGTTLKTGADGLTLSAWVKPGEMRGTLASVGGFSVALESGAVVARAPGGETARAPLATGSWQHVAVTLGAKLSVYVNGAESASVPAKPVEIAGDLQVGRGFVGEMDELQLASVDRGPDWIRAAALGQGTAEKLVGFGKTESEGGESHGTYFRILLDALTLDGWIVVGILMVMLVISFAVMIGKAVLLSRVEAANQRFLARFNKTADFVSLDHGDVEEDDEDDAPAATRRNPPTAIASAFAAPVAADSGDKHSTLYRIYHQGVKELQQRFAKGGTQPQKLSPQALNAIRAALDAQQVRENNRLNSQMVLLTIAISGGPFLGLLGTVVGVMITFAAIAAVGDVNVNSIAPGIAAALIATVAGLAVAIPALFGYNYLLTRIKTISSEMQIFVDELVSKFAEDYS